MSSPVVYVNFQPDSQPGFLQGDKARGWGGANGYMKDIFVEIGVVGVRSRFINVCPNDALAYHGSERGLVRYVGDTDDGYAQRLNNAWNLWVNAGTAWGMIQQFGFAGFPSVYIRENWDWPGMPPGISPITHLPYAPGEEWWRFWVVIDDSVLHLFGSVSFYWDDGVTTWDDGSLWDFTIAPPNISKIHQIINTWKPAHTICAGVLVILEGWVWDGLGITWDDGHTWDSSVTVWI